MTNVTCPITGDATVQLVRGVVDADGTRHVRELRWLRADPEIHVAVELLDPDSEYAMDEHGRSFLEAMYEIGEHCPYLPRTRHARRKDRMTTRHVLAYITIEQDHTTADIVTAHCSGCDCTVRTTHSAPIGERPVDSVWLDAEDSLTRAHRDAGGGT